VTARGSGTVDHEKRRPARGAEWISRTPKRPLAVVGDEVQREERRGGVEGLARRGLDRALDPETRSR
jgi:hypothetical protein